MSLRTKMGFLISRLFSFRGMKRPNLETIGGLGPLPNAEPEEDDDYYYGGGETAWQAYLGGDLPPTWDEIHGTRYIRSTGQAGYYHLASETWVYEGNREIHCRLLDSPWADNPRQVQTEGIYAVYDPGVGAFYWYVGDPTNPGVNVHTYCLAEDDTPPVTSPGFPGPWTESTFVLWSNPPV
jgi:hypothetical protein